MWTRSLDGKAVVFCIDGNVNKIVEIEPRSAAAEIPPRLSDCCQ